MAERGSDQDSDGDERGILWPDDCRSEREQMWNPYYNWNFGAAQPYCDTMYHTRFYPQKSAVEVQCSAENTTSIHLSTPKLPISHSVKLMNRTKKKEYKVEKLSAKTPFDSLDNIKTALKQLDDHVGDCVGYIEPGHGLKGKQKWLLDDDDVSEMYAMHKNKREVMLYALVDLDCQVGGDSGAGGDAIVCNVQSQSRKRPKKSDEVPTKQRDGYAKTITQVETIMSKLKEKHGSQYDTERYACWAHTIQSGKHSSYDDPPDFPYFSRKKKNSSESHREDGPSSSAGSKSPTKRLCLRSTCIDQLSKWHDLLQSGAISQVQYDEMKDTIMKDMTSLI